MFVLPESLRRLPQGAAVVPGHAARELCVREIQRLRATTRRAAQFWWHDPDNSQQPPLPFADQFENSRPRGRQGGQAGPRHLALRLTKVRRINPCQPELLPAAALDIGEERIAVHNGDDKPGQLARGGLLGQRLSDRGQPTKRQQQDSQPSPSQPSKSLRDTSG